MNEIVAGPAQRYPLRGIIEPVIVSSRLVMDVMGGAGATLAVGVLDEESTTELGVGAKLDSSLFAYPLD